MEKLANEVQEKGETGDREEMIGCLRQAANYILSANHLLVSALLSYF